MLENRDPAIKLFGRTIQLPANGEVPPATIDGGAAADSFASENEDDEGRGVDVGQELVKETMSENRNKENDEDEEVEDKATIGEQLADDGAVASESGNSKTPLSAAKEAPATKSIKAEEEQSEVNSPKERAALKKPDKILPCPRCNSMDTKFCYYNNYNVNQPRHFCKNCQRYWTAGGTMRNVPVGAGRRKNKSSANHYRHITISDTMQAGQSNHPETVANRIPLNPNATCFSFTPDAPLCESMTSALKLAEKGMNGFHAHEEQGSTIPNGVELRDEQSNGSSKAASTNEEQSTTTTYPAFTQIPCFPPPPWAYPWNPAQWRIPMPQLPAAPPLARPASLCTSNFCVPFFPATAYWGCAMPAAWSVPWISPPSPSRAPCGSGSNFSTLGKHSREENSPKQSDNDKEDSVADEKNNSERCLWIPKTLRIDDPGEAAKSSIWTTLGFNTDKGETISAEGMFRAFPSNVDERSLNMGASYMLQANPAALSRSLSFRESS